MSKKRAEKVERGSKKERRKGERRQEEAGTIQPCCAVCEEPNR